MSLFWKTGRQLGATPWITIDRYLSGLPDQGERVFTEAWSLGSGIILARWGEHGELPTEYLADLRKRPKDVSRLEAEDFWWIKFETSADVPETPMLFKKLDEARAVMDIARKRLEGTPEGNRIGFIYWVALQSGATFLPPPTEWRRITAT